MFDVTVSTLLRPTGPAGCEAVGSDSLSLLHFFLFLCTTLVIPWPEDINGAKRRLPGLGRCGSGSWWEKGRGVGVAVFIGVLAHKEGAGKLFSFGEQ